MSETDIKVGDIVMVYDEIKVEILLIKDGNYYFFDGKDELKFTTIENLQKIIII